MTSVTIVGPESRLFRIRISNVYCMDLRTNAQMSGLWFEGNFDNFRTFKSGPQDKESNAANPTWRDYEILFTYETSKAHMLLAKLLSFTFYCTEDGAGGKDGRHFVGEAHTDLLHIALGPQSILLTVMNGDVSVGDVIINCEMEEVAEAQAIMRSFEVQLKLTAPFRIGDVQLNVESKCKQPQPLRVGLPRSTRGSDFGEWADCGVHFMGITAMELMQEAGFRFTLTQGIMGGIVARGMVQFGAHMSSEMRLQLTNQTNEHRVGKVQQEIFFERIPLTDANGQNEVGTISGLVYITDMPYFVQMYSGSNIDGEIFDGKRYADYLPLPPNVNTESRDEARTNA